MAMTALISVDGVPWPEPSTYSANTATIVDSGRNVEGKVVGSVVRHDVAKIELSWKYLTAQQWADILSLFTYSFDNEVRFYNQATANYDVRTMYCSDRNASAWRRNPQTGEMMGWTGCSLSLVEV